MANNKDVPLLLTSVRDTQLQFSMLRAEVITNTLGIVGAHNREALTSLQGQPLSFPKEIWHTSWEPKTLIHNIEHESHGRVHLEGSPKKRFSDGGTLGSKRIFRNVWR